VFAPTEKERRLLDRLAVAGKATRLLEEELHTAKNLEAEGLLFLAGWMAVVTPRARRLLAELDKKPKRGTPPFRFT